MAAVREELGDLPGETLGVGAIAAAAAVSELLALRRPSHVVLIGSAGAYPGGPPVGVAVAATRLGFGCGMAELGLSYSPVTPPVLEGDAGLVERVQRTGCSVLTVPSITLDPAVARRFGAGWEVEHLEAYGAAWACARVGVPFLAVLGIANAVGPDAHREWVAHRAAAEAAARDAVRRLFV